MSSRTSAQPALPASEQAAPDEPARSRKRAGLSRETLVVRVLQVSLGVALLGLWQLAAAGKWPDPVLAKSPVQSWDYLAGAARSGALWSNTRSTMTAVLIAWVLAGLAGVAAGLALGLMPRTERVLSPYLDAANAMPPGARATSPRRPCPPRSSRI